MEIMRSVSNFFTNIINKLMENSAVYDIIGFPVNIPGRHPINFTVIDLASAWQAIFRKTTD